MPEPRPTRAPGLGPARQMIAAIAVSGFGTWSYNVAIAVYVYDRTHSASWVAAVTVGRYVPALVLSWLARSLIDRLPRRAVAIGADVGCAGIMLALAIAGALDAPLWVITACAAISSTFARIQAAAVLSLTADVVTESALARASRLAGAAEAMATAAGAAGASLLLIHFTPPSVFVVNAVTFALSAGLLTTVRAVRVRPRPDPATAAEPRTARPSARVFWPLQAARTLAAVVYGIDIVLLTVVAARQFHSGNGTGAYGWLLAATGVGGLLAITPIRRGVGRTPGARLLTTGMIVYALPLLLLTLRLPIGGALAVQVMRGCGAVLVTSSAITGLQRAVPSTMAGRVFGATQSLVLAGTCVGALVAPVLLSATSLDATIVIAALVPVGGGLVLYPFLARFDREEGAVLAALDPRLSVLRGLDLLRDASRSTLYEIADSITEQQLTPAVDVVVEGDRSDALYVLAEGTVEVTGGSRGGRAVLRTLAAPDYFGEIGVLHSIARTSTVTTVTPCTVWRIPAEVFLAGVADAGVSGALTDTVQVRIATRPSAPAR